MFQLEVRRGGELETTTHRTEKALNEAIYDFLQDTAFWRKVDGLIEEVPEETIFTPGAENATI